MHIFEIALGILIGIGLCAVIPRIPVGLYSAIKKRTYQIVDITTNEY